MVTMVFISNFDAVTMDIYNNDEVKEVKSICLRKDGAVWMESHEESADFYRTLDDLYKPCEFLERK